MKHVLAITLALIPAAGFSASGEVGELIVCPDYEWIVAQQSRIVLRAENNVSTDFEARVRNAIARGSASSAPQTAQSTCSHTIRQGDTLSDLANIYLSDSRRWREIAALNPSVNPNALRVGTEVTVPCGRSGGAGAVTPSNPASPQLTVDQPVALPVWQAEAGSKFTVIVKAWAERAGYTVVIDTREEWVIDLPVSITAPFTEALEELTRGLAASGTAPVTRIYSNRVVRIG